MSAHKNIIWDWNGTIVNDAWVFVDVMNLLLKQKGLPLITLEHYRQNFCFPIQNYWRNLGFRFTEEAFNVLNTNFIDEYQNKMFFPSLHKGLRVLLKKLRARGVRQFVLSASEHCLLKKAVTYYRLGSFFSGVYGVDNLNAVGKEALGLLLCNEHQLAPNETLLIGDTEYDVGVAKTLGCTVVLVSHGHINHLRLLKTGSVVVSSVKELEKYLAVN